MKRNNMRFMVGFELLKHRRLAGLTQSQLAHAAGISAMTISRIERGKASPEIASLRALSTALNIPLSSLLEEPSQAAAHQAVSA